jgi:hypothetical protein
MTLLLGEFFIHPALKSCYFVLTYELTSTAFYHTSDVVACVSNNILKKGMVQMYCV